jgi:hypothetical protein
MKFNIFAWIEKQLLDTLSVLVPYAVPVIPAYLTYFHTINQMNFPPWVAWTAAFVVEALGLTSVATAIKFWRHNLRYTKAENRAPFWVAVAVYVFYIVIVLWVNVALEQVSGERTGKIIFAIALFSLLSFPSGVLYSIRVQYGDMLQERAESRSSTKKDKGGGEDRKPKPASHYKDKILEMLDIEFKKSGKVLSPKEITASLKLDHSHAKGYISTLTTEWKKNRPIGF